MARLEDVSNALVALAAQATYPNGTSNPSVTGGTVRLYHGWPVRETLDRDLAAGITTVTVYPSPTEHRVPRFLEDWLALPLPQATMHLVFDGTDVVVTGTPAPQLNAALIVNGKPYVYPLSGNETLSTVATALAALVNVDTPASSVGPRIVIPGAWQVVCRVGVFGTSVRELKRQSRVFQIIVWAPTQQHREAVAEAIDTRLAALDFLALPDGTAGRLQYEMSPVLDDLSKVACYRRDLRYSVEWATTESRLDATITVQTMNLQTMIEEVVVKTINF